MTPPVGTFGTIIHCVSPLVAVQSKLNVATAISVVFRRPELNMFKPKMSVRPGQSRVHSKSLDRGGCSKMRIGGLHETSGSVT